MKTIKPILVSIIILMIQLSIASAQSTKQYVEVGETMKEYIKENHIDQIEDMVHQFASSRAFLEFLLEQGHHIDMDKLNIKKKDIGVGEDLDVFVKHFSEHQNFTMILVPVNFYSLLIYDTLLFSIVEVSDQWMYDKYRYHDLSDNSVKERLLSIENHDRVARHMYDQGQKAREIGLSEVKVELREGYISSNTIHMHVSELSKNERKEFRRSWDLMKKVFSHDINLNIEMNVYVFGTDDMKLHYYEDGEELEYKITPGNIFTRHHFLAD
ncbi:hypothetical protein [Marinoscillum sp. MHG1-6]|uniref:hypothetical protein n=1 Tax=Marinoscillum sp. MHG1-6 TaxID=2959627 RepID=UPI002157ACD0|nr:hypothetical protein [Marinoscillum sp. MHG1-6]